MPKIANFLLGFQGPSTYVVVFLILLECGFGVPIPEDITLIAAGVMAYYQAANVWGMITVGFLGVMLGDGAMFWLGRRYGLSLARKPWIARLLPAERLERVGVVLRTRGVKILFAARFMPGLRSPLFFTAGALGVPARAFILYDGMAALISVPAIIYSVYFFGHQMESVIQTIQQANRGILALIVAVALFIIIKWRLKTRQGTAADPHTTKPSPIDIA